VGDLLRQGRQWLEQRRIAHCSSPVTYRRGETELPVNATLGRTEYEVEDESGLRIGAEVKDFLISDDELTSTFGEPEAGDQIIADGIVYEVMSLAGQGHWRWSGPHRITMRIHTKDIGADA